MKPTFSKGTSSRSFSVGQPYRTEDNILSLFRSLTKWNGRSFPSNCCSTKARWRKKVNLSN